MFAYTVVNNPIQCFYCIYYTSYIKFFVKIDNSLLQNEPHY